MSAPKGEPWNPFYLLLLLTSLLFVMTVLAVAFVPVLEQKAREAGGDVPDTGFHKTVRQHGVDWLIYEVAAMILFALCSMGLDRLRRLQMERAAATIPPTQENRPSAPVEPAESPCPPPQTVPPSSGD